MFLVLQSLPGASGIDRVSVLTRCLAKGVDLSVILVFSLILPYPLGVLLGFCYTLVHDGFWQGQSLGKKIFHLKVMRIRAADGTDDTSKGPVVQDGPCTFKESALRNAPLGVATFFGIIPFWGWILLVLLGIPLIGLEIYLMITLPHGGRLGDIMADTRVIELKRPAQN